MKFPRFVIVNTMDAPCARLVCVEVDGVFKYVDPGYESSFERPVQLSPDATDVEDFGFTRERVTNEIFKFVRSGDSVAKYRDGDTRHWQGDGEYNEFVVVIPRELSLEIYDNSTS